MPPSVLGPWTLERLLGSGGMADVWLGVHADGRRAAVKRLRSPTPALRARFDREARVLGRLDHPGIVHLVDTGVADGAPWMATTFVDGPDLRQYAERLRGRPPGERAARTRTIALALCRTLAWLHEQGLVHRDVKPSNVLLGPDGEPVLIDFGVVAEAGGESGAAPGGGLVGTAAWAAPEQIRGEPADARADQYGLGGTLYFLLTGRRPFPGESTASLVKAHLEDPVPAPSLFDPTIPVDLETFVLRLLAKDPADRFPSLEAAAAALAPAEPVDAPLAGRQPAIDTIAGALREVAEGRPVVLRVTGPRGSGRAWIARMARDVAERRGLVCVVAEEGPGLAAALAHVERGEPMLVVTSLPAPGARTLALGPLSLADVRRSLFAFAPRTPELAVAAERLHRHAGGLPGLFLRLLHRYRTGDAVVLPDGPLEADVGLWLDGLDLDEATVAGALAILTAPASEDALSSIAQVPAEDVLPVLTERGIATRSESGWRLAAEAFRLPLQAAVPDLDALRDRADAVLPAAPGTAGMAAVEGYRAAAAAAIEEGRTDDALTALAAATDATAPFPHWNAEIAVERAQLEVWTGRVASALERARRATAAVEGSFDPHRRCSVLLGAATVSLAAGAWGAAASLSADAAALARARGLPEDRFDAAVLRARAVLAERPHHRTAAGAAFDRVLNLFAEADRHPLRSRLALDAVGAHIAGVLGDRRRMEHLTREVDARIAGLGRIDRLLVDLALGRAWFAGGVPTEGRARAERVRHDAHAAGLLLIAWHAARLEARTTGEPLAGAGDLAEGLGEAEREALEGT